MWDIIFLLIVNSHPIPLARELGLFPDTGEWSYFPGILIDYAILKTELRSVVRVLHIYDVIGLSHILYVLLSFIGQARFLISHPTLPFS